MAGSGTCLHESRRELRDVVLVRQTELACRNTYDQDLWELSENPVLLSADVVSSGGIIPDPDIMFERPADDDGLPGSHDDVLDEQQPNVFTDHVTNVRVPGPRRPSPLRPRSPFASELEEPAEFDQGRSTKTAVHDAHERREHNRREAAKRAQDEKILEIGRHMTSGTLGDREDRLASAGLAQPEWKPAAAPVGIAGSRDIPDFEFEPVLSLHNRTARLSAQNTGGRTPLTAVGNAGLPTAVGETVPAPGQENPLDEQRTEPLPTEAVRVQIGRRYPDVPVKLHDDRTSSQRQGAHEPFVHVDGPVRSSTTNWRDKQSSSQLQTAEPLDPIDRVERIASLPRCCATCRDFRQVGNDGRGSCNNPYAFSERRMVKSDQLACRSSLGMWWMPNDDVWLERADTSHHGRPTPLLDASLKIQRPGEAGRDSHA